MLGDRRHKTYRFIVEETNLEHDPHDFNEGYKAIPFGLALAVMEKFPMNRTDKHGNQRIALPTTWNLFFNIRFNRLHDVDLPSTYSQHIEDLDWLILNRFKGKSPSDMYMDTDSGSEANYHTLKSTIALSDFFKRRQLGTLIVSGPAANDSSGNSIERLFSEPKKAINSLQIPDIVGTDTVPPSAQSDLSRSQRIVKDNIIQASCGESLKYAWERIKIGGSPISVRYDVPSVSYYSSFLFFFRWHQYISHSLIIF